MAALSNMVPEGTVAEHADGRRAIFRNGRWNLDGDPNVVNLDRNAPGSAFLPKLRQPGSKSEEAYFRKFRETDDGAQASARAGIQTAREMEDLLTKQKTGGWYGLPVIGSALSYFDPELRTMDALQAKRARQNRQPGEGAISDFDAQQFMNMTYGRDKPTATNQMLIKAQRIADDAVIQRRHFAEWYYNKFGSMSGAPEAWDRYAQENPIFAQRDGGGISDTLNDRRQNWRQYFGDVRSDRDKMPTAAYQDIQRATPRDPRSLPQRTQPNSQFQGFSIRRLD